LAKNETWNLKIRTKITSSLRNSHDKLDLLFLWIKSIDVNSRKGSNQTAKQIIICNLITKRTQVLSNQIWSFKKLVKSVSRVMLQSLSKYLKVITKNQSRRTNERQKHLTGVCFHFIKSQLHLYSHLLLNLKKTIRNQSKRRICLMRSNKLKKQRKKMNHLKKMRLKEKKRVLKKNQILKIFATEEESLILLRNTNKS